MRKVFIYFLLLFLSKPSISQDFFFQSDDVRIRYTTKGTGVPVVLIHGMTQSIEGSWHGRSDFFIKLAENYRVIALDIRGHGKSDKPHLPSAYGKKMVTDVINLMNHLKIDKAHIIGFSMGAVIAENLLINYPHRVLSAILSGGLASTKKEFRNDEVLQTLWIETASDIEHGKGMSRVIKWLDMPGDGQPGITDAQAISIGRSLLRNSDTVAIGSLLKNFNQLFTLSHKKVKRNGIPTLIVYGTKDAGIVSARKQVKNIGSAELLEIPDVSHGGLVSSPIYFIAVQKFLQKQ